MKEPSNYELARYLEIDENIINNVLCLKESIKSLDSNIEKDDQSLKMIDIIVSKDNIKIDNISLKEGLKKLDKKEQELIVLRYFKELSQAETAKYLKTNQVQISRSESKILKKLKKSVC